MIFMGRGFTSVRQESGLDVLSAAVCKIQTSKCYIESLLLVPKDKRSCFSQDERSTDCTHVCPLEVHVGHQLTFVNHL